MESITQEYLTTIRDNKRIRQRLAFEDPLWFSLLYLRHHFTYPLAPFHLEMFHVIQRHEYEFIVVMAFRGSGKSTILNMANVLWSILGKPGKKFVIIVSMTQEQAKNHFTNIKAELETNELLREDFGPFAERPEAWNKLSLDLTYHDAKILSVAREQSVRGLRHGPYRPDFVVCDDIEDSADENNSKDIYEWFAREIVTVGGANMRIVALGNLFRKDSFMMRLREDTKHRPGGIFRAYPIIDAHEKCLWPGKFPNAKAVGELHQKIPRVAWTREFLLDAATEISYQEPTGESEKEKDRWSWAQSYFRQMRKTGRAYQRELEKAGKLNYQNALIKPMKKFAINAPIVGKSMMELLMTESDSPYSKKYKSEMERIIGEMEKKLEERLTRGE